MLTLLLVMINTVILIFLAYPILGRLVPSRGSSDPDKEVPVDGYQYGDGPIAIKDADKYDFTDVFVNSGWRYNFVLTKGSESGIRKTYEPAFSLKSD